MSSAARAALHHLVDQLPDEAVTEVTRVLARFAANGVADELSDDVDAAIREARAQHARGEAMPAAEAFARLDAMIAARRGAER